MGFFFFFKQIHLFPYKILHGNQKRIDKGGTAFIKEAWKEPCFFFKVSLSPRQLALKHASKGSTEDCLKATNLFHPS